MAIAPDDRVPLGEVTARTDEAERRREREHIHLTLLDEAERGWADVEAGRVRPIVALRAKYARRR